MALILDPPTAEAAPTANVESIAAGGAGVARFEGRVVFLPRTAPGDRVRFRVTADKGKFLRGEITDILEPGPARRSPPCRHWAECGGCPLQQLEPAEQVAAKKRIFLDALARIGKLEPPAEVRLLDGAPEFFYRTRVRFQVRGEKAGFFATGSRRLIPIESCLLAEPAVASAFAEVRRFLHKEPKARFVEAVEITALGPGAADGAGMLIHPRGTRDRKPGAITRPARRAWEAFAEANGFPVAFAGERGPLEPPAWTARYMLEDRDGAPLALRVSPESFLQPNRAGNRLLIRTLLDRAGPTGRSRAVDLFCGAGNFSLPLARAGARVLGVEENPYAALDAEANAREAGLEGVEILRAKAERLGAEEIAERLGGPPDLVLLDPPRRGALEAMPLVRALAAPRVLYISCNPATLARDGRELAGAGYQLEEAILVPMFPNTAHVEILTSWRSGTTPFAAKENSCAR